MSQGPENFRNDEGSERPNVTPDPLTPEWRELLDGLGLRDRCGSGGSVQGQGASGEPEVDSLGGVPTAAALEAWLKLPEPPGGFPPHDQAP